MARIRIRIGRSLSRLLRPAAHSVLPALLLFVGCSTSLNRNIAATNPPIMRVRLLQSSLTYVDRRLAGYDAAVLMEVVEHLDPERLPALEHAVFGAARPATVVVTTPNVEHNVRYPLAGALRHPDHRFEWTRAEFAAWARGVAARHGYTVDLTPVGADDPEVGAPTQLATFSLEVP